MSTANAARGRTNRGKGNEAERAAAKWLTAEGWPTTTTRNAERGAGRQSAHGDLLITDAPHVITDVKNVQTPRVMSWLSQLYHEADGRPHQVLLWKHPDAAMARPGEWLAFVANHPLDWFEKEVGKVTDGDLSDLGIAELRAALGWFTIEHGPYANGRPALFWDSIEFGEWLLMRASTWATEVLPCWEGQT